MIRQSGDGEPCHQSTVYLPVSLHKRVKQARINVSEILREAIVKELNKRENPRHPASEMNASTRQTPGGIPGE